MLVLLELSIVLLPLSSAVAIRFAPTPDRRKQLAVGGAASAALLALLLFFAAGYDGCAIGGGSENCFWEALASLALFAGGSWLAYRYYSTTALAQQSREGYHGLLLLSPVAGLGLANNLLFWLLSWALLSYLIHLWLRRQGVSWGFLVIRDDHKENEYRNRRR